LNKNKVAAHLPLETLTTASHLTTIYFNFLSPFPIVTAAQARFHFADDVSKITQHSREYTPPFVMTCSVTLQTQDKEVLQKEHKVATN